MNKQVDLRYLKDNFGEDEKFLKEMIHIISNELPGRMEQLGKAVDNNQPEEARSAAHSMKSSLKMLGLQKLLGIIEALEKAGENNENLHQYKDLMMQANALFQQAQEELKDYT